MTRKKLMELRKKIKEEMGKKLDTYLEEHLKEYFKKKPFKDDNDIIFFNSKNDIIQVLGENLYTEKLIDTYLRKKMRQIGYKETYFYRANNNAYYLNFKI